MVEACDNKHKNAVQHEQSCTNVYTAIEATRCKCCRGKAWREEFEHKEDAMKQAKEDLQECIDQKREVEEDFAPTNSRMYALLEEQKKLTELRMQAEKILDGLFSGPTGEKRENQLERDLAYTRRRGLQIIEFEMRNSQGLEFAQKTVQGLERCHSELKHAYKLEPEKERKLHEAQRQLKRVSSREISDLSDQELMMGAIAQLAAQFKHIRVARTCLLNALTYHNQLVKEIPTVGPLVDHQNAPKYERQQVYSKKMLRSSTDHLSGEEQALILLSLPVDAGSSHLDTKFDQHRWEQDDVSAFQLDAADAQVKELLENAKQTLHQVEQNLQICKRDSKSHDAEVQNLRRRLYDCRRQLFMGPEQGQ